MNQTDQMREALRRYDEFECKNCDQQLNKAERTIEIFRQALSHVNETPKNEHDSDDVLNKSGNGDMMREALRKVRDRFFPADQPERDRDILWDEINQALAAERAPLRFVQSDKGSVIVVINKGSTLRHAYGVVVESTAYDNSPIEVADFVQEKDALLFAKIWNSALTELAEKPPLVRLTDQEILDLREANNGKLNFVTFREFRIVANAIQDAMEEKNK